MAYLDYEKTIEDLKRNLELLKSQAADSQINYTDAIAQLEEKINALQLHCIESLTPLGRVQLARHPQRPYPMDYCTRIFKNFMEFHGDRRFADDAAIFGGFAWLDDMPVMVIGTRKGRDLKENLKCHFGSPYPEGYRKALRLMRLAEKANCPIVTFVDTPGAYPGIDSEERLIGEAIAYNLQEMFDLSVPVVSVITGEGGSGGALALAVGNAVLIQANAYYSVITPEGCAAILWRSADMTAEAAKALKLTAKELLELNVVDEIIPEPIGGAHTDPDAAAAMIKPILLKYIKLLKKRSGDSLKRRRFRRFRALGEVKE